MPKGLKMKKLIERPDGTLVHDTSYVGEDAWEDDREAPEERVKQIIEDDERLNKEEKKELTKGLGISGYLCIFWFFYSFTFHLNLFFLSFLIFLGILRSCSNDLRNNIAELDVSFDYCLYLFHRVFCIEIR